MRQIETFAGRKGVAGFMITSVRSSRCITTGT